jgi:hypothetical protein
LPIILADLLEKSATLKIHSCHRLDEHGLGDSGRTLFIQMVDIDEVRPPPISIIDKRILSFETFILYMYWWLLLD